MVNENVTIDDVQIGRGSYRNFSGVKTEYNKAGNRQFSVFLPRETAEIMMEQGWFIKQKPPRREGEDDQFQLDVAVGFGQYPPVIKLVSYDGKESYLTEESVGILDATDIERADLEIRPYNWEVNGKTGTKAYVRSLTVKAKPPRRVLRGRMDDNWDEEE